MSGFREDILSFCCYDKARTQAAMFLTDQIHFSYFCIGSSSDYFDQSDLNSDHGFREDIESVLYMYKR